MTITTPSRARNRRRGFTLVEVMISASLGAVIMAGVLSTFLFLGRSAANVANYADLEASTREALEFFGQDTRQASEIVWNSASSVTLVVNGSTVTYAYDGGSATFTRTQNGNMRVLMSGVTNDFSFTGYMINGNIVPTSTAAQLAAAGGSTKQLQIYLKAQRSTQTAATASHTVLSARFILRNKRITA